MPDPIPEPPAAAPASLPPLAPVERPPELEEQEATARLIKVWSLLPGRFPWVTFLVVILAVALTGLAEIERETIFALVYAGPADIWEHGKWWGLLGSVFLHVGLLHLLFNCYWTWLFGRLLEREIGPARLGGLLLAGAWCGSAAELAWSGTVGVGLSGVVYALFGFLLVNRARHPDFAHILTSRTMGLLLVWLIACIPFTYLGLMRVANAAHVGGVALGCLIGVASYPHRWRRAAQYSAIGLGLASFVPLFWAPQHDAWLVAKASAAVNRHDYDRALELLPRIQNNASYKTWAAHTEGLLRQQRKEYARARDCFAAVANDSSGPDLLNVYAWLLATCPAAEVRDGARAIHFARLACERTAWKNPALVDTLAAAYAESGDFAEAEKWMLKALENPGTHTALLQSHLDAFRHQKPWREP